jgi:hypothetical protein
VFNTGGRIEFEFRLEFSVHLAVKTLCVREINQLLVLFSVTDTQNTDVHSALCPAVQTEHLTRAYIKSVGRSCGVYEQIFIDLCLSVFSVSERRDIYWCVSELSVSENRDIDWYVSVFSVSEHRDIDWCVAYSNRVWTLIAILNVTADGV